MKYLFPIVAVAALTACNAQDAELTADELAVCEGLGDSIAELQKRNSGELAEAVLMNQMRAQGQLDAAAGDPADVARFSMLHYQAQLGNVLTLMEGNGCDLPTEPIEGGVYSQAAGACLQARVSGNPAAEGLCDTDSWEANPETDDDAGDDAAAPAAEETDASGD